MNESDYQALCFGKLPNFGDFIRYNASGIEVRAFDQWIEEGLTISTKHFNRDWNTVYKNVPAYHFLFCPENTDLFLVGILQPSYDKSARKYPFVVSKRIDKKLFDVKYVHLIPLIFTPFFDQSKQLIRDGLDGLLLEEIAIRIDNLKEVYPEDLESGLKNFEIYLANTTLENFWSCLFGDFDDPRKFLLIKNLIDILLPPLSQKPASLSLGLRFPLSPHIYSIDKEVCFWIQVCRQLLGNISVIPNIFWKISKNDEQNYLFLFFRKPSTKIFVQLMQPLSENDTICKLEEEGQEKIADADQNIPSNYRSALEIKESTLSDFLNSL